MAAQLASFSPTRPSPPFPLAPLSFSTVYSSYATTSSFPLFTLPPDIWPLVTRYLSTTDLRSLARVDRDCRKLAELRVWGDLKADFGQGSYDVLKGLMQPSKEGRSQGGKEREEDSEWRGRARCVRLVHVGPPSEPPYTIRERVGLVNTGTQPKTKPPNAKKYLARLLHLLACPTALPHLYVLEWNLPGLLSPTIVRAIRRSGVKHLRVCNGVFGEDFLLAVSSKEGKREGTKEDEDEEGRWELESLAIEGWSTFASASVLVRLLHSVAPTLRQLVWKGHLLGPVLPPSLSPASEDPDDKNDNALPDFPNLRTLNLDRASPDCSLLLHHLLGPKTRVSTLALDSATPATASFLCHRGYVSSLKTFAWVNTRLADPEGAYEGVMRFLEENDQLERFEVTSGVEAGWVEGGLVPVLSRFTGLTELKVVFCGSSIPESTLSALASLAHLQTLHIAAGPAHPSTPTWVPSHETIYRALAPLKKLKTLAFTRDTYEVTAHPLAPRRQGGGGYYRVRALPEGVRVEDWLESEEVEVYRGVGGEGVFLDVGLDEISPSPSLGIGLGVSSGSGSDGAMAGVHAQPAWESHERRRVREAQDELATLAWERWHAAQMRCVVQSYAEAFERLEWCFVGQLVFGVEDVYDDEPCEPFQERRKIKRRMVFTDSKEEGEERRDPCGTAVERRMGVACWRPT